ncbi:hypothetical protein [Actinomadura physcomitrii]|uniref:hypothetical protein n=1 Tax=Actinomadura physcomitrii TaxID=2650748 RepID=UPI0019219051|nr:hypothetical protein [Actinomadura physcomitrii]
MIRFQFRVRAVVTVGADVWDRPVAAGSARRFRPGDVLLPAVRFRTVVRETGAEAEFLRLAVPGGGELDVGLDQTEIGQAVGLSRGVVGRRAINGT